MSKKKISARTFELLSDKSNFATIESYKTTRTNLMFKLLNNNDKKTVVFTSAQAHEGKTTVCINLAVTFAQAGSRVLIIDADMRCPSVHRYLKTQSSPGLSDKIGGFAEDKACVYRTVVDNLFVMPAGSLPPNPAELLLSNRMDSFLKVFTNSFDYVFIDAPPVGVVTDAAIIGSKCDGVVFICRQRFSRKEHIRKAIDALDQVGANLFGFVFNDCNDSSEKRYSGKYYKGYGKNYYSAYNASQQKSDLERNSDID
ncbi:MAG: CpsD/CapB family tyrosine-protein kinase [Acutalibacteraceae bacterium]